MPLKTGMSYQLQNERYIFVLICFLSRLFLSVPHFVILCSGYRFADGIQWKCKEVVDLRFVHLNAAQLPGIFFPKSTDMNLLYKLVGTLFTSCWLLFMCFLFQFIFVLPARYVRMRNFSGKSKQVQAVYRFRNHWSDGKRNAKVRTVN